MGQTSTGAEVRAKDVKVWDPFVRLFHWGVVALVATAFITQDWKHVHMPIGYAVLALVAARIVWGFIGTKHARFRDFVARPRTVLAYLRALREGHPRRYQGHNPAGGAMVLVLLALLLATAGTGWLSQTDAFFGNDLVSGVHSALSSILIAAAGLHVLGVLVSSVLHRENLLRAMLTGRKPAKLSGEPQHKHRATAGAGFCPR